LCADGEDLEGRIEELVTALANTNTALANAIKRIDELESAWANSDGLISANETDGPTIQVYTISIFHSDYRIF